LRRRRRAWNRRHNLPDAVANLVAGGIGAFVRDLDFADLPADVVAQAQRCLLDLIGVAAAGSRTRASAIANGYAATQMCGAERDARILFDGRRASLAGAAFAGASTIDAFDAHDGHPLTKGHAGAAILPAILAVIDGAQSGEPAAAVDGRELITSLVLGYEIGTRAGMSLHATVADYHCSGSWNALACASVAARLLTLDAAWIRDALGVAEYFGPRGQMLRTCDAPTMVKDGTGWGAHVGISAALLARDGFTGAPALTVEAEDARAFWGDLGTRWRIREQYFKAYPVCRWAQPAVEAALALQRAHRFAAKTSPRSRSRAFARPSSSERRARSLQRPKTRNTACGIRSPRRSSSATSVRSRSARRGSPIRASCACSAQ
jgi:2-methylcitrate dehydratase PrpD